jgi:hypothetical protein
LERLQVLPARARCTRSLCFCSAVRWTGLWRGTTRSTHEKSGFQTSANSQLRPPLLLQWARVRLAKLVAAAAAAAAAAVAVTPLLVVAGRARVQAAHPERNRRP